ncbi:MAG: SPASM domain-containing protein [Deltaproteobacteria bacterium]|nr:SPASM domain-containing protein [Deltaproteobacteria bacterium]
MKRSKFVIIFPSSIDNMFLLYNTLTGSLLKVDEPTAKIFTLPWEDVNLNSIRPENLDILTQFSFLIPNEVDEDKIFEHFFFRINFEATSVTFTLIPTEKCNLKCTYCIMGQEKNNSTMSLEIAKDTAEWMINYLDTIHPREFFLHLYGGEPLLNLKAIELVSGRLKEFCRQKKIEFSISIATNGILFTSDVAKRLKELGLARASITLDGTRDFHNQTRPFPDGRGTYDIILKNILKTKDIIDIIINANYSIETVDSMVDLLDELSLYNLQKKLRMVKFSPIIQNIRDKKPIGCSSLSNANLADIHVRLREEAIKRGFIPQEGIGVNICGVTRAHDFTFDTNGDIYKCPAMAGIEKLKVGSIYEEDFSYLYIRFTTMNRWKKCRDCPYLPLCAGGCPYLALLNKGNIEEINCERKFLDGVGGRILEQDYA